MLTKAPTNQYEVLLDHIFDHGVEKGDRTGTGTVSSFGHQLRYDLSRGFPLVTTKKVHFKSIAVELLWFLSGDTNTHFLHQHGVSIWDEWATTDGELGPVYGKQWRDFGGVDQISELVEVIRSNPNSRRMVVSAWNPVDLPKMALEPCHCFFQVYVSGGKLSLQVYQRSADMFLGVPFNIASYALLTHMLAQQCDLAVGDLIWTGGDCHIYLNHLDQVTTQLRRLPYPFPTLNIKRRPASIFEYQIDDFEVLNYEHHPAIKAAVAV